MSEIRLSGILKNRYQTKFYGLIQKYCLPLPGYSLTPCSYPNNLSSHPIRDCSMHSPLRVKIQNALNKALQLEHNDVLFVGGRRRNRKRRKHGKDKKKSRKYEGKETPVLKAKTYNGTSGKYVALLADDDISLSPSIIDDFFDGHSANGNTDVNDELETPYHNGEDSDELPELCDTKSDILEEMNISKLNNDRPLSCDTGYDSTDERRFRSDSEQENTEDEAELAVDKNIQQERAIVQTLDESKKDNQSLTDDVFTEDEDDFDVEASSEFQENNQENLMTEILKAEEDLKSQNISVEDKEITEPATKFNEDIKVEQQVILKETMKEPSVEKKLPEPRVITNFDYDDEEEEEVYTKQPRSLFKRRRQEEDEETKPLICCGNNNGEGFACCTIL